MRRAIRASLLMALLTTVAVAALGSSTIGHGETQPKPIPHEEFTWDMIGESDHWVVILRGYGSREDGRVTFASVKPWVIWAGGGRAPRQFEVDFVVDDTHCLHGTLGFAGPPGSKVALVASCKLVYPQSPSVSGEKAEDFIGAIKESGRFILKWNQEHESIRWGRAFAE